MILILRGRQSLQSFCWYRVVLDEGMFMLGHSCCVRKLTNVAHIIRQSSTLLSRAVFALKALRRWAVTGTPIQNRLTDLASLFIFLRVHPFDDLETFKNHVVKGWKSRSDPEAVAKLKLLISSITLRRSKQPID